MGVKPRENSQRWLRISRGRLLKLAQVLGNESILLHHKWPENGEGRDIKAATETIFRLLSASGTFDTRARAFRDLLLAREAFADIEKTPFYLEVLAPRLVKFDGRKVPISELFARVNTEVDDFHARNAGLFREPPAHH